MSHWNHNITLEAARALGFAPGPDCTYATVGDENYTKVLTLLPKSKVDYVIPDGEHQVAHVDCTKLPPTAFFDPYEYGVASGYDEVIQWGPYRASPDHGGSSDE